MDALSSQANLAGYVMVMQAATHLPRIFPMMMTPAGTLKPANVFMSSAPAWRACRPSPPPSAWAPRSPPSTPGRSWPSRCSSLGAAKFLEIDLGETGETAGWLRQGADHRSRWRFSARRRRQVIAEVRRGHHHGPGVRAQAAGAGHASDMIEGMAARCSVIVDMAAETGGNVEGSVPNEVVDMERGHHHRQGQPGRTRSARDASARCTPPTCSIWWKTTGTRRRESSFAVDFDERHPARLRHYPRR